LKTQRAQGAKKPAKVYTNDDLPETNPIPSVNGGDGKAAQEGSNQKVKEDESEQALSPTTIPPGISYKRADKGTVEQRAELVKRVLAAEYAGTDHILSKVVLCGPS